MFPYEIFFEDFLRWIKEDIPYFDLTTKIVEEKDCKAVIIAKDEGVAAGIELIKYVYEKFGIKVNKRVKDGDVFYPGQILMEIEGNVRDILMTERTIINLMSHMCGIAKMTRKAVEIVKSINDKVRVAATRKTHPGLRLIEKYAVEVGGGDTHRFCLSDMILIKDNHIKAIGSVEKAIDLAKKMRSFSHKIEIEVVSKEDAIKAAELGADIIMLDNMGPDEIKDVVEELKKRGLREKVILEASGNIKMENLREYASSGVDVISMGVLTHSSKACNISLEVVGEC
ncbi:MAG: carboxylating nicotinate-nucleotide diphosphorylase [Candidatus Asgardarchaeia archaeon]